MAEDIDFLLRLRRLGRLRGQRFCRLKCVKTITSARKFDLYGDWHFFTRMPALAWATLVKSKAAADLVRRYWYEGR